MNCYFLLKGNFGNHFYILSALNYMIQKYDKYNIKSFLTMENINDINKYHYLKQYKDIIKIHQDIMNIKNIKFMFEDKNRNCYDLNLFVKTHINTDIQNVYFLDPYFQGNIYFSLYKDKMSQLFLSINNNVNFYINEINKYNINNICFISIRRGDYFDAGFIVLNKKYYIDAYNKYFEGNIIFMSCDDIEWCKQNLTLNNFFNCKKIYYIDNLSASEIYTIARLFKHYICANSTFSSACELSSIYNDKISIGVNYITLNEIRNKLFSDKCILINDINKYIENINE